MANTAEQEQEQAQQLILDYYIGLDLGQAQDPSALSVVEKVRGHRGFDEWGHHVDLWLPEEQYTYSTVHLERFPLGTPYPKIVEAVSARVSALPMAGRGTVAGRQPARILAVDATGVGRPVIDLLRDGWVGDVLVPISIHGGSTVTHENGYYNVPKRDLIGVLVVLMQQRRLRVSKALPEAQTLLGELRDYRYKLTAHAHETFNAKEGKHDDLVLSVACAVWAARTGLGDLKMSQEAIDMFAVWENQ